MTVNSIYQSFSVASVSLSINARPASPATTAPAAASPGVDRVTLSPEATADVDQADAAQVEPAPTAPVPAEPRRASRAEQSAERRAEALFGALDADQDGAITEQEFTEGAVALLRRAGDQRRVREHDGEGQGHGDGEHASRGLRRLERKLEKAFGRVDANDDGAIDKDELTSALAGACGRRCGNVEPTPPTEPTVPTVPTVPQGAAAPAGTTVTFSFTFVSVAVQRYTALRTPAQPDAPASADDDERRAA